MHEVLNTVAVILGWVMMASMLIRSFTLVPEALRFHKLIQEEVDQATALYATIRAMFVPALLSSPGWVMVARWSMFLPAPEEEIEAIVEEVLEGLGR